MFMARVNDKNVSKNRVDCTEDGDDIYLRNFFLMAVEQCRPIAYDEKRDFLIQGKTESKTVADFNRRSRVHGRCNIYFDIDVPYNILEEIAVASQSGFIPRTTVVNLRMDNWDNIKSEYESKTGLFAYRKKQENTIK